MKATKVYILKIDNEISHEYASHAARSCEAIGLEYEFFIGYTEKDNIAKHLPVKSEKGIRTNGKGGACTAGHIHLWHTISEGNECSIVLEHDSIMLHKPEIDIPDGRIVALGYKVSDPENYNHLVAGPPNKVEPRKQHGGAHAYALTPNTAKALINNIEKYGMKAMVDNRFFLRQRHVNGNLDGLDLGIADPICALGWIRKSTIWGRSAVDNYRPILPSFLQNYHSKKDMGLKG